MPANGAVVRALWGQATARGDDESVRASAFTVLAMAAAGRALRRRAARRPRRERDRRRVQARLRRVGARRRRSSRARARRAATPARARAPARPRAPRWRRTPPPSPRSPRCCPPRPRSRGAWYPAAEQSIAALYALHPDPEGAAADVLRSFAGAAFPGVSDGEASDDRPADRSRTDASHLARFLFVLGEVGLRHLVHVESLGRAVRRARAARDRKAAESAEAAAAKGDTHGEEAELAAALGQGAVAEDTPGQRQGAMRGGALGV